MLHLRALMLSLLAVLALMSPSLAVGLHIAQDGCGPYVSVSQQGEPANLPTPCELMGGKRVMPTGSGLQAPRQVELPRATDSQWQFGLTDDPIRKGRGPARELRPPRAA